VATSPSFSFERAAAGVIARGLSVALSLLALVQPLQAQEDRLEQQCEGSGTVCLRGAQAAAVLHGGAALPFVAGNPVQGTASTLGIRLGSMPRLSLGGRISAARLGVPEVIATQAGSRRAFLTSVAVEGVVGIAAGFSPVPTVGGVGSLDALGSAGFVLAPSDFGSHRFAYGAGFRLGLLRESFTMPGLSVTGMWRGIGRVTYGDPERLDTDGFVVSSAAGPSVRAAVGKRLLGVGLTAGAGFDRWRGDVEWAAGGDVERRVPNYVSRRTVLFGNVSWTFLVLHAVIEGGWQSGPRLLDGLTVDQVGGRDPARGAFFGGATLRLSI
jgi:hypothetical protein